MRILHFFYIRTKYPLFFVLLITSGTLMSRSYDSQREID